jgi:hypothetical protein
MSLEKFVRLRASIAGSRQPATEEKLARYLEKVRTRAYAITDEEVAALLAGGHSEDEVFETTVVAALDAAIERYQAGLRALEEADQ